MICIQFLFRSYKMVTKIFSHPRYCNVQFGFIVIVLHPLSTFDSSGNLALYSIGTHWVDDNFHDLEHQIFSAYHTKECVSYLNTFLASCLRLFHWFLIQFTSNDIRSFVRPQIRSFLYIYFSCFCECFQCLGCVQSTFTKYFYRGIVGYLIDCFILCVS